MMISNRVITHVQDRDEPRLGSLPVYVPCGAMRAGGRGTRRSDGYATRTGRRRDSPSSARRIYLMGG